ncbi:MAG TPA: ADP-glyceromanno-heptose 6-epimerase [Chitinophagales bacterium]|nr:ADP-glyceromanno-heptose 6-epimerase [Chitinophagales bacterium]
MQAGSDNHLKTVVVTGAMGFIGSCLAAALHRTGAWRVVISDDFNRPDKMQNLIALQDVLKVERDMIAAWVDSQPAGTISWILHIGARTDTTEFDHAIFDRLNRNATKALWEVCCKQQIPLIYASSAATYGSGVHGYVDNHALIPELQPLNPYGWSKQDIDMWVLKQQTHPPFWYGLKFFNVYGPNEYHKGRMASVIFHAFNQMQATGTIKLFRSHKDAYRDGYQLRDFVYVLDVVDVIQWLMHNKPASGIYNLGTGKAEPFYQLAASTAEALNIPLQIDWIDIPEDIRDKYQYFTEADMSKLRKAGYTRAFSSLEAGVADYVKNYLVRGNYY